MAHWGRSNFVGRKASRQKLAGIAGWLMVPSCAILPGKPYIVVVYQSECVLFVEFIIWQPEETSFGPEMDVNGWSLSLLLAIPCL